MDGFFWWSGLIAWLFALGYIGVTARYIFLVRDEFAAGKLPEFKHPSSRVPPHHPSYWL